MVVSEIRSTNFKIQNPQRYVGQNIYCSDSSANHKSKQHLTMTVQSPESSPEKWDEWTSWSTCYRVRQITERSRSLMVGKSRK